MPYRPWVVRPAGLGDAEALLTIARHLDTVNLPHDEGALRALLRRATASFEEDRPPEESLFFFVLEGAAGAAGTSMIFAQHGTRGEPHVYFDVLEQERYSRTLDRHRSHRLLRLGFQYDGPTEIGGLVLRPSLRSAPERLGRLLSLSRFLFLGAHRHRARDTVLAELMPPLEPDGSSRLWSALGERFTGLSYREADRLSAHNKEFILELFPREPIPVALLPPDVEALLGAVGPDTKPVERMLTGLGFRYAHRIDPFDGGPHFTAPTDAIGAVAGAEVRAVAPEGRRGEWEPLPLLVARVEGGPHRFRATVSPGRRDGGALVLPEAARRALGVEVGEPVRVLAR